jgi:N-hydroxyarylamine O-acetyltransferase
MKIEPYLRRIEYYGPTRPTLAVLRKLHRQHLLTVPFENLDIHDSRPIQLDQKLLLRKIVGEHRGGYCYELNSCFAWLLKKIGFNVRMLSARVAGKSGRLSPEFDHMTLVVLLKERWLADVGFGDLFIEPKKLDSKNIQHENGRSFRLTTRYSAKLLSRKDNAKSSWKTQFLFHMRPHKLADFAARNRYQQTSPNSHFTQGRIISKLTQTGRVSLTDSKLVVTTGRRRAEQHVKTKAEFNRLLTKYFGY